MPLYEYQCEKCHTSFEQLIRGQEQAKCPKCESTKVAKQLSVVAAPTQSETSQKALPMMDCGAQRCCGGGCQMPM